MTTIGPSRWFTTNRELAQFLEREVGVKIVGRPSTVNFHRFITIAQFDTRICFWIAEESQTIMSYSKISLQCWMEIKFYSIGNGLHPLSCASQVKLRKALERRRHFRIVRNEKWEWWGGGVSRERKVGRDSMWKTSYRKLFSLLSNDLKCVPLNERRRPRWRRECSRARGRPFGMRRPAGVGRRKWWWRPLSR